MPKNQASSSHPGKTNRPVLIQLRPFQEEGVRAIYRFKGRALLGDEQGLGKTVQALSWIYRLPKLRPVVIVTPASMKYTWQAEASLHFGLRTEVLEGRQPAQHLPGPIVVLNYQILSHWLPTLLKHQPQCVVLDECQAIKNKKSQRTKAALALTANARSVLGLSGTPILNRPIEFWSALQAICPGLFPKYFAFGFRYCGAKYTPWGWQFNGAARSDELHSILVNSCMIRRLKKDVAKELPTKSRKTIVFRLSDYREYEKAHAEFLTWLRQTMPGRYAKAKKCQALVKVGYLLRLAAQLKSNWVAQWIEEFLANHPGKKLVALTMHRDVIKTMKERFRDSVVIDGSVTGRKRQEIVRMFQLNTKVRLLFGNVKAAGVGITLTAASDLVYLDFPWTPGDLLQGEDRIHRIGQKEAVMIYYLAAKDTIEEKLMRILHTKAKTLASVLDGKSEGADLDVFNQLLQQ